MKTAKRLFTTISFFTIFLLGFASSNAQEDRIPNTQKEQQAVGWTHTNYKVYLKTVVGTNNSSEGEKVSRDVSELIKNNGADYSYSNYFLFTNGFHQVANRGKITSSNVYSSIGNLKVDDYPIDVKMNLGNIEHQSYFPNEIKFRVFSFSADIPVKTESKVLFKRWIYNLSEISMVADKPTLIGSSPIPQTSETLFFILTVKKV